MAVVVDPFLAKKLRPHQREGVRWMWRALHGLSPPRARARGDEKALSSRALSGCLLADDMGLGKSLQSLALVWTMLRQGPRGVPTARRALLVCPASLVGSWGAETNKWLGGVRAQAALAEGGGTERAVAAYERWANAPSHLESKSAFDRWPILVTSYETLRRLAPLAAAAAPELLVCDEAHRLRNARDGSQTLEALKLVDAPMRVLLTGTPVQNDLDEYAAVMDFACPGLLGDAAEFHREFTAPVRRAGEPGATPADVRAGERAAAALAALTADRVLRRESSINAAHLPAKTETVVFCRLSETQRALYEEGAAAVRSWTEAPAGGGGGNANALCAIGLLRQLANSVDQALGRARAGGDAEETRRRKKKEAAMNARKRARVEDDDPWGDSASEGRSDGEEDQEEEEEARAAARGRSGAVDALRASLASRVPAGFAGGVAGSGKLAALRAILLALASRATDAGGERAVVVSSFSAALDSAGALCASLGLATDRLDGRTPPEVRSGLVREFNAGRGGRVMLLSCVAGGAGLTLVGASRLVLFDTSWNPAHDHQAMARVWRDGQTRPVTIYRLLAAGTIEEKVFQRQLLKRREAKAAGVAGEGEKAETRGTFSRDELAELVKYSAAEPPATLAAVGWTDARAETSDSLLKAAVADRSAAVAAVAQLAGDGGRARAVMAAEEAAAARPKAAKRTGPKRLAFADLLSRAKNRAATGASDDKER